MPRIKREEAKLLAYTVLFNKQGQLITERISTDIKKLKKFLNTLLVMTRMFTIWVVLQENL